MYKINNYIDLFYMKFLNFTVFIISLALGLLFVYLSNPDAKKIIVYPTPDNEEEIQYKDLTGNCFKAKSSVVQCPSDSSKIFSIPLQN